MFWLYLASQWPRTRVYFPPMSHHSGFFVGHYGEYLCFPDIVQGLIKVFSWAGGVGLTISRLCFQVQGFLRSSSAVNEP